jgi:tetratricopeptide (TPR) repeat protein
LAKAEIATWFRGVFTNHLFFKVKSMRWKPALLVLLATALPGFSQVRVWEGVLDLPVYEEGAPDPNPPFDQFATTRFNYPYTLRNETTEHRGQHHLRAIYLENEYLKCSVLPDVGGHVYTCMDKISGQPMFYANSSIKKARIGYRGAWAAFGIEFNFPVSHNWMSMSPVDFSFAAHRDGSGSVTVGNIDRVYGMEWTVELILRPGSTVLEQRVWLSNRSDVRQRFYWWNNAAVQVWDDSRIEYPMQYAAAHGFAEVQTWPIDEQGKDLSIIRNQTDGPVSLFAHGSREDFMGIWHPHTNTGVAHFARYNELPAKKIWSWGVDADGLDWRKALSDDNSAYAEVQAGLFRNQETYSFLEPRQYITFSEYWMPVRGTGGISRANLTGVIHLERKDDSIAISLNANRDLPDATVQLLDGSNAVFTEKVNLKPEQTWTREARLVSKKHNYTLVLKDRKDVVQLRQTEGQYDWTADSEIKTGPQANYVLPNDTGRTEDDWLQAGNNEELNGDKLSAVKTYERALRKFPSSFELLKAAGRLDASLKRFEEALPRLAAAQARNTTDGEISYYLGMTQEAVGRERDAIDSYEASMRSPEHRASSALRLAELRAREGKLAEAGDLISESLKSSPDDLRAHEEQVAILSAIGETSEATKQAKKLLQRFPLSAFLREVAGDPDITHLASDPYRILNVATQYARLGLYRKALEVLSRNYPTTPPDQREPGTVLPQDNPLVGYFRGYCRQKLGESGSEDFAHASQLSTLYVFPNSIEEKQAMEDALGRNMKDATAHDLLGTWYFARAKTQEALREWNAARQLNPRIPALHANIGLALLHEARDFDGALNAFEDGIKNDPKNIVNYSGAVAAMALLGKSASDRMKSLERYPELKQMPTSLVYELALTRAEAGNYEGAVALFHDRFFGREEGGTNVRQVWIEVKLQQALALAKSDHCVNALAVANTLSSAVAGFDFTRDGLEPFLKSARTKYLLAEVYASCGQNAEADARFEEVSKVEGIPDMLWAWSAAKRRNGYDPAKWAGRLNAAVADAKEASRRNSSEGWWFFIAGTLRIVTGEKVQGQNELREVFLLPDSRMSHHLSRLALVDATLP